MGIVIRQSVITSIISYFGVVIGYINLLILYPKFLAAEQIGLLRTIQDAALLMAPFAQFGLGHSILRFFPGLSKGPDKGNSFVTLTLLLSLVGYAVFLFIFLLLKQPILGFFRTNASELLDYTQLVLWLTLMIMVITILEYYSRSLLRIVFPNLLREVGLRLMQLVLVTGYFYKIISFDQFLLYSVIAYLLNLVILLSYLIVVGGYRLKFDLSNISGTRMKEILAFSTFSFVGTSASIIISKIDSLMVSGMKGFSLNAVYTTAFYMATVIEIPKRAITQSTTTLLSRAFEENDLKEVHRIYQKTALNQAIIGSLLLIGIWANLPNLFNIMPNGDFYSAGMYVVLLVGGAKLVDMLFGPSSEIIVLSKYYKFNIVVVALLAITGLSLNYLLIPPYGVIGAAVATSIAVVLFNSVKCLFIYLKFKLQPFSGKFLVLLFIAGITVTMNYLLPQLNNAILDLLYRSSILTLIFGGLVLLLKVSEEVQSITLKVVRMLGIK